MKVIEALRRIRVVALPPTSIPVEETCAEELLRLCQPATKISRSPSPSDSGVFEISTKVNLEPGNRWILEQAPDPKVWAWIRINETGAGELIASHPSVLYAFACKLLEDMSHRPVTEFASGRYFETTFRWHRPLFDYLLTQVWRSARNFEPEQHIREMARAGYTHLEVNAMAAPRPLEESAPGEFYAPFYSYGLALDQYVDSSLNRGVYPPSHLRANLQLLKEYAQIGQRYGLQPGILCFEPRSLPESFFEKHPTLRGPRVDHPFRSRKPRYALALAHPLVQEHYRALIKSLLTEAPQLSYMSIWSNDSGAGFEHTCSLYVGRNGGPYLIREWGGHAQIAEAAGRNVVDFLKLLRDAAREINPDFRVSLRLEPFKEEHDEIVVNLEPGIDIEAPSLHIRGYDSPYAHPKYPDVAGIAGTVHHLRLRASERERLDDFKGRGLAAHLIYSHGNGFNFEPLLGIPFPWMLYEKLHSMQASGVEYAANLGGFVPSGLAPYHINQEVFRSVMLEPDLDIESVVAAKAAEWVGPAAAALLEVWRKTDEAIRWLPTLPLYSSFGFVWLRLWVRPLTPDLLAIPESQRHHYEAFMVSSANNTNLTDLSRDVLFRLVTQESGRKFAERVDERVRTVLNQAVDFADLQAKKPDLSEKIRGVFVDQRDRLQALQCWIGTLRNVAAWCAGVHGYLSTDTKAEKQVWRNYLEVMIDDEIQNTGSLLELWQTSATHFMAVSHSGETCFLYGDNFVRLLQKKIELMAEYRDVKPRIDPNFIWRL